MKEHLLKQRSRTLKRKNFRFKLLIQNQQTVKDGIFELHRRGTLTESVALFYTFISGETKVSEYKLR